MVEHSLKLADYVKYDNVGTWEWIVSRSGRPYLLEVNTRIQVENDVSARISYLNGKHPNLLQEQIRLALGDKMGYEQKEVVFKGASIELRIVAENPARDFAPWIGTITRFDLPRYEWSAVYSHVPSERHYPIPSEYDPNLALALVWGDTVQQAKERARQFIDACRIEGADSAGGSILTNLDYLRRNLDRLLTF